MGLKSHMGWPAPHSAPKSLDFIRTPPYFRTRQVWFKAGKWPALNHAIFWGFPMHSDRHSRFCPTVRICVLILILTPLAAACYHRVQVDDPYITYRYARNLAEGRGFIYNPDERVLGTTAPLYAMLLALGGLATDDYPLLSSAVSGIALGGLALLIYRILALFKQPLTG